MLVEELNRQHTQLVGFLEKEKKRKEALEKLVSTTTSLEGGPMWLRKKVEELGLDELMGYEKALMELRDVAVNRANMLVMMGNMTNNAGNFNYNDEGQVVKMGCSDDHDYFGDYGCSSSNYGDINDQGGVVGSSAMVASNNGQFGNFDVVSFNDDDIDQGAGGRVDFLGGVLPCDQSVDNFYWL